MLPFNGETDMFLCDSYQVGVVGSGIGLPQQFLTRQVKIAWRPTFRYFVDAVCQWQLLQPHHWTCIMISHTVTHLGGMVQSPF